MISFLLRLWKWRFSQARKDGAKVMRTYIPEYEEPDLAKIHNPDPSKLQVTWVGHSTFLIQTAGQNILTDPMWSERASPLSWLGPKRHAKPGLAFSDLPRINIVLISHTHYDHLDRPTIRRLGSTPHYILPTGVGKWFSGQGITTTTELPWWSAHSVGPLTVTAVPAKHWSKRNLWGTSGAGWSGYMLETPAGVVYFAGDTGYHETYFTQIRQKFSSIDLSLIPVGAYYPQWIFGNYHVDPHDAVLIHKIVGSKKSIGMHWGTFKLTEEPLDEPPQLLAKEAAAAKLDPTDFTVLKIGETASF